MRSLIRKTAFVLGLFSLGLNASYVGAFTETLPDASALGAVPYSNSYDWSLTTKGGAYGAIPDPFYQRQGFGAPSTGSQNTGVAQSTATTAGNSLGSYFPIFIISGAASPVGVEGSIICSTGPVVGQGMSGWVCPATSGSLTVIGVAASAVSTGTVVNVYTSGFVLAQTTGTVSVGDVLVSTAGVVGQSASTGLLATQNITPPAGAVVGVAMAVGSPTNNRTLIRLKMQ